MPFDLGILGIGASVLDSFSAQAAHTMQTDQHQTIEGTTCVGRKNVQHGRATQTRHIEAAGFIQYLQQLDGSINPTGSAPLSSRHGEAAQPDRLSKQHRRQSSQTRPGKTEDTTAAAVSKS